jgi:hypothetical protein
MRTAKWIAAWLALSGVAGLLHMAGEAGVAQVQALPFYVPLVIGAVGQMCFYRALRSAIGDAWSGLWGGRKAKSDGPGRGGGGFAGPDDPAPTSDFDADAAFARYMERRTADAQSAPQPAARPAPRAPRAPTPAPRPQGGFGRKVI